MTTTGPGWQWVAERALLLISTLISIILFLTTLYLNSETKVYTSQLTRHDKQLERYGEVMAAQAQLIVTLTQRLAEYERALARYDNTAQGQAQAVGSMQVTLARLGDSVEGLRRDLGRIESAVKGKPTGAY